MSIKHFINQENSTGREKMLECIDEYDLHIKDGYELGPNRAPEDIRIDN
jgi:hypothetical protein